MAQTPTLSIPLSLKPMEAEPVEELPLGKQWLYEPKYDGFRCLAFRDGDQVELQSKKQKSLNRFFPDVVAGLARLTPDRFVLDGELIFPASPSRRYSCACMPPQAAPPGAGGRPLPALRVSPSTALSNFDVPSQTRTHLYETAGL